MVELWFNFYLTDSTLRGSCVREDELWTPGIPRDRATRRSTLVQPSRRGSGRGDRAPGTGSEPPGGVASAGSRRATRRVRASDDLHRSRARLVSKARSVIYIFLSGGLSQLESFDLKPDAPAEIRGEFRPIATKTPGIEICEYLPRLAERSHLWALVRSLTHGSNDHSAGHHIMLTGRSDLPSGFDPNGPRPGDWPSIAAVAGALTVPRHNLPPAVVLPETLVHNTGRIIPGQFAGLMGPRRDPWFIEASPFDPTGYGAYPAFEFDHQERTTASQDQAFPGTEPGLARRVFSHAALRANVAAWNASITSVPHSTPWRQASRSTGIDRRPSRS